MIIYQDYKVKVTGITDVVTETDQEGSVLVIQKQAMTRHIKWHINSRWPTPDDQDQDDLVQDDQIQENQDDQGQENQDDQVQDDNDDYNIATNDEQDGNLTDSAEDSQNVMDIKTTAEIF